MNDVPARTDPEEAAIGRPTQTARRLVEAAVSPNTRRAYAGALRRLDAWLDGRELHDVTLAAYLAELHDAGRASSSAAMAVAAACFRAKLAGQPAPAGERTARVLAGYRRTAGDRGRGQARAFGVSDLAAVLATCHRPRRRGRGIESDEVALKRGRLDAVIAGLLFMAGMRRSEVSALRWADVADSTDGGGILVTVRRSKTNQEGEVKDVRFVKDGVARALRTLRAATGPEAGDRVVPLSAQMIGLRFTTAARAAGVESRVTAHSGRVGLASELTSRGASTTDVMLAGNWKTSRMVAHYSAGAKPGRCAHEGFAVPVPEPSPAGNVAAELLGRMPERRWRVLGRGRGLFAIDVDDGGGFRAATTAEVDAALRQRELFGAAGQRSNSNASAGRAARVALLL